MARPRTHHEGKKQELIKVSFDLFMEKGYENTSIQDIMNVAQVSKGAMYHYFTCKEDILDAVLNYIIDLDVQRLEPIIGNPSLSALEKMIVAMSGNVPQVTEELQRAIDYITKRPASIFDYRARELSKNRTVPRLIDLIKEGVETGEFHTEYPAEMAVFIYSAAQTISELLVYQADGANLSQTMDAFIVLLANCLGLEKERQDFLTDFFHEKF